MFRLIAKALGEKASSHKTEADKIAYIRIFLVTQAIITNCFIIANFLFSHIF